MRHDYYEGHCSYLDEWMLLSLNVVLWQTCQPLMAMVKQWVLRGELIDPHDEFFIEQRAVPLEELWGKCYNLRDAMLPSFVSKPLAHKILLVGKVPAT